MHTHTYTPAEFGGYRLEGGGVCPLDPKFDTTCDWLNVLSVPHFLCTAQSERDGGGAYVCSGGMVLLFSLSPSLLSFYPIAAHVGRGGGEVWPCSPPH